MHSRLINIHTYIQDRGAKKFYRVIFHFSYELVGLSDEARDLHLNEGRGWAEILWKLEVSDNLIIELGQRGCLVECAV